jgi:hypothetical protein
LGIASCINAWDVSDEVGEMLDNLRKDRDRTRKHAEVARQVPVIKEHDGAVQEAASIRARNAAQGEAAAAAVRRLRAQAMTRSAGVVGHGRLIAPATSEADVPEPVKSPDTEVKSPSTNGHQAEREVPVPSFLAGKEE